MKRAVRMLCAFLSATMLIPLQALGADIVSKPQAGQPSIVINEVESDAPNKGNDWVEITNIGTEAVDISGWYLTDDKGEERKTEGKTTPLAKGTILEPGAFLVLEETKNFDFGFGKVDTAILYDAASTEIDSYAYTPA
ncbi:MAG: lamin tail domain-containing protein [Anaerobutyricum sp.]